ncbi:hypothetical protein [Frigoribacterium sp. VKM Ac-1396]|uniref:hypothetical protein n=1 Tax=Frigoribacterium sp. VKM Ac-1396 TaxID=2783821 RepID=UPI001E55E704|nr:hypothetical protein [Frigoribacterium sp. VKM Ac-1396]
MVTQKSTRAVGLGRVLIAVYALLALAATGRSVFQISTQFGEAPLAYTLSALSAVVYIVATVALIGRGQGWYAVAWATISFELAGVLIIGLVTVLDPELFPHDTVWSFFGRGYGFVPLVLPVLGILWLRRQGRLTGASRGETGAGETATDAGTTR